MSTQTNGKATFFAFISHKSTDAKFALKLQKFIESYNLPTEIRRMTHLQERRLTPVCSYEVDFSSNPLMDEMHDKLKRSKYLILICSEELVKSGTKYVNYEIRTFIECKKEEGIDPLKRIIPIIVTGEFGSAEHECCPEALKELGDNCPIALDLKKYKNDRELFLHVISGLLDIDYAVIENRDKKRQRIKKTVLGSTLALLLAAGIGLGEYYIPRESHYVDFVMKDGLPEGIGALTADAYQQMKGHYVITERKHKIESLEYVNAYGNRIDHGGNIYDGDRPSAYIFEYTASGLSSVTYEDRFGTPYFIMQYSGNSISSVDLRDPYDSSEAFYIGSGYESDPSMLLADLNLSSHSDISRFRYEYSDDGYVTQVVFCSDSTGRLAQDNSVYGFEYVLDEKGRIIETYFLDALGERRLNSEGLYCRKFTYDSRDDMVEWTNYGRNGAPMADGEGIVQCVFSYDQNHNLNGFSFFDENGDPLFVSSYGGAGQKQYVDEHGNLILVELLEEDGGLCERYDYCSMAFTYDENGFTASRTYQNPDGEAVISTSQNYATIQYVNDENGNPVEITYYDAQGNIINNAYGFAKEITEYDDMGRELKHAYFDAEGMPADYRGYGYSSMVTTYDERGRETSISYYGQEGEPVNTVGPSFGFGYHRIEEVYEYGAHTKQTLTYYDAGGDPVNLVSSLGEEYSKTVLYIQNGEITYMANYCADGSIYGNIMESETDRSAQAEPITTYRYTDSSGNILSETVMYYQLNGVEKRQTQTVYDENKNAVTEREVLYYDNGQRKSEYLIEYAENGAIAYEYLCEYDEYGNVIQETLIDPADPDYHTFIVNSFYDDDGNLTEEKRVQLRSDGSVASTSDYAYHVDGSKDTVEFTSFDESGTIQSKTVYRYDNDVKISSTQYEYDENGSVAMVINTSYSSDGSTASREYLDYDDTGLLFAVTQFIFNADGTTTQITTFYDENENVTDVSQRLLDEDGNVIG